MTAEIKTGLFGSKHSPNQVLVDALQHSDRMESVVIVFVDKDGYICSSWSDSQLTTRLGVLDVAAARMIDLSRTD